MRKQFPKRIIVEVIIRYDWLFSKLLPLLEKKYNIVFFVIVSKSSEKEKYKKLLHNKENIIITADELIKSSNKINLKNQGNNVYDLAERNEKKYRYNYLKDIIQQDRQICGKLLPLSHFPWDEKNKLDFKEVFKEINSNIELVNKIFKEFKPQYVVIRPGWIMSNIFLMIANYHKIPTTMPRPTRYKSFVFWTLGPYSHHLILLHEFLKTKSNIKVKNSFDLVPPEGSRQVFENFKKIRSTKSLLKKFLVGSYNHFYHKLKSLKQKNFNLRPSYLSFIREYFFELYSGYYLNKISVDDISKIPGKKILFMLPKEPEYTVQSLARDFANVHAIIMQIAWSLPADTTLLIKEHSRLGFRKIKFYEDLKKFDNIKFVNPFLRGIDLMKYCDAGATIVGTIGLECGFLGKKCLIFSKRVEYFFLSNIVYVENLYNLKNSLQKLLQKTNEKQKALFQNEVKKYYETIKNLSFDAAGTRVFEGNKEVSEKQLLKAKKLMFSNYSYQIKMKNKLNEISN